MTPEPERQRDLVDRGYRRLLTWFPVEFRDRFGTEMIDLFRARRMRTAGSSTWTRARVAGRLAWDTIRSIARERRRDRQLVRASHRGLLATVVDDTRAAARLVWRAPGLTAGVAALMGLTIAAATIVFTIVNAVLLTPPPFRDPDRLVLVWEQRDDAERNVVGAHEFPEYEQRSRSFERMAAITYTGGVVLTGAGEPASLFGVRVTSGFFDVMGVPMLVGRGFRPEEDQPGQGQVAVLSERLWRERCAADRSIAGKVIVLDGQPFAIVGVMPAGFKFPPGPPGVSPDFWTPIAEPIQLFRGRHYLQVVARLKPGVTAEAARTDLAAIAASLEQELPQFNKGHRVTVLPLRRELVRDSRASLLLLLGGVGCLVLIGCTNVAGLLVARGLGRRHEISVHLALGATRTRVARRLFVESILLAVAGGALGIALATLVLRIVPALVPPEVLVIGTLAPNGTVLMFALVLALVTGLIFGVAPAVQLRRFGLVDVLTRGGRTLAGDPGPRLRRALVVGQIALAVILVLGAALMMRGLAALHRVDPGFQPGGVLAVELKLPQSSYRSSRDLKRFHEELEARVGALPGVIAVGAANNVPLSGQASGIPLAIEGRPTPRPGEEPSSRYRVVSAGYFRTMGIPIVEGRGFTSADSRRAVPLIRWWEQQPLPADFDQPQPAPVAVINQALARAYWLGESPIGAKLRIIFSPPITIVGVVADTHNDSLRDRPVPELYLSTAQEPGPDLNLLVRSSEGSDLGGPIRSIVRDLDAGLPVTSIKTMNEIVGSTLGLTRFLSLLLGLFGGMALVLMAAGVYGLIVFTVSQRLPELGIRTALGAGQRQIVRLIVRDGLMLALVGIVIGAAGAFVLSRLVRSEVFGVDPTIVSTFAGVAVTIALIVWIAGLLPARRAARVDPTIVLK